MHAISGLDVGRDRRQMIDVMLQSELCFGIILLASSLFLHVSQQSKFCLDDLL